MEPLLSIWKKHLTLASPVFKETLMNGWKESVTPLQQGSIEMTTSGWDLESYLILLKIINFQHDKIPQKLSLNMLAKITVIADYYGCKKVLSDSLVMWIENLAPQDISSRLNPLVMDS
ncbi:hypothetical protein N7522_006381 [Penicillium canescens]|nr:hypothetical protein N7522_006381 [Penicillium canescens]